jgi:phosphoglycolate phosphatase
MAHGLAIFDLDGTLVDSREDLATAGNAARLAVGLPALPVALIMGYVGEGVMKLIERLTPDCDAAARTLASGVFHSTYADVCCHATRPYAGIPEALQTLRDQHWLLGVATNKSLHFTELILEHCQLRGLFAAVRGGDATRKPDPTALLEIINETTRGAHGKNGWMIGDHHTDIEAGHAAGLRVAWCAWGIGSRHDLVVEAVLTAPSQLPQTLIPVASHG